MASVLIACQPQYRRLLMRGPDFRLGAPTHARNAGCARLSQLNQRIVHLED